MSDEVDQGVRQFKEPGGFWIPNEFVDLHAPLIGSRGVYLYITIIRCVTPKCYPTISELAALTQLPSKLVRKLLYQLHDHECLNDFDMEKLFDVNDDQADRYPEEEPD